MRFGTARFGPRGQSLFRRSEGVLFLHRTVIGVKRHARDEAHIPASLPGNSENPRAIEPVAKKDIRVEL
jgi:hypothetical protein